MGVVGRACVHVHAALHATGKMEELVAMSDLVLIILTREYLTKPNCRRELTAALRLQRTSGRKFRLLILRETDPDHGAVTIEQLEAEAQIVIKELRARADKEEAEMAAAAAEAAEAEVAKPGAEIRDEAALAQARAQSQVQMHADTESASAELLKSEGNIAKQAGNKTTNRSWLRPHRARTGISPKNTHGAIGGGEVVRDATSTLSPLREEEAAVEELMRLCNDTSIALEWCTCTRSIGHTCVRAACCWLCLP